MTIAPPVINDLHEGLEAIEVRGILQLQFFLITPKLILIRYKDITGYH